MGARKAALVSESAGSRSRRSFLTIGCALFARTAFGAKFTDITLQAGLGNARNVSGPVDNKQYLVEEMGCGVALIDYDNDGWLDIFLPNGSAFELPRSGP